MIEQAEQSVDYFTIHAEIRLAHIPATKVMTSEAMVQTIGNTSLQLWPQWLAERAIYPVVDNKRWVTKLIREGIKIDSVTH